MCLNCGCHLAHEDHGSSANVTYERAATNQRLEVSTWNLD